MIALIRCNVSPQCSIEIKKFLYLCVVRSQLTYCSQLWTPRLIKDIILLERVLVFRELRIRVSGLGFSFSF